MNSAYLTEAFKELNMLNEEAFDVDEEGVADFKELISQEDDVIDIIDDDAAEEEEIEDSYVGKVILDCSICHSKIYKDAESIIIDNDKELVNVGEECPYCYSVDGYRIIGQIAPYEEEADVKVEIEDKDNDGDVDEVKVSADSDEFEESLKAKRAAIIKECKNTKKYGKVVRLKEEDEIETLEDKIEEVVDTLSDEAIDELETQMIADFIMDNLDEIENDEVQEVVAEIEAQVPEAEEIEEVEEIGESAECDNWKEKAKKPILPSKKMEEDLEKVELETEDSIIKISEEEKEEIPDAEMIEPLDVETEKEIVNSTNDEVEFEQEVADVGSEEPEAEDEFVDQDFEEFDEEEFDDLGESYLKKVYENVQSFKTSKVSTKGNTLKLEGIITFNSGNKKTTTFLFEAKDITKRGKVRFIGENKQITKGNKAFVLTGKVSGNKLIAESLNYNYRTKGNNGKSVRLYGTVKR